MKSEMRIMDFSVRQIAVQEATSLDDERGWIFLISMVYSDSTIKVRSRLMKPTAYANQGQVWKYTSDESVVPDRQPWSLIATTRYTTASLSAAGFLGASHVIFEEVHPPSWPLVTGATDGSLQYWTLTDRNRELTSLGRQSVHQNCIKCMHTVTLSHALKLIFSGGDDNALGITLLAQDEDTDALSSSSLIIPRAHAASINAITTVRRNWELEKNGKVSLNIVSASNDQMIIMWHVTIDTRKVGVKGVDVRREGRLYSAVADISSLEVMMLTSMNPHKTWKRQLIVCGVGTEIWHVL
jgi:hypothetical protein